MNGEEERNLEGSVVLYSWCLGWHGKKREAKRSCTWPARLEEDSCVGLGSKENIHINLQEKNFISWWHIFSCWSCYPRFYRFPAVKFLDDIQASNGLGMSLCHTIAVCNDAVVSPSSGHSLKTTYRPWALEKIWLHQQPQTWCLWCLTYLKKRW